MTKPADDPLTWAGALALDIETTDIETLRAAWNGDVGRAHREALRTSSPEILRQLAEHVRRRVASLKEAA